MDSKVSEDQRKSSIQMGSFSLGTYRQINQYSLGHMAPEEDASLRRKD